MKFKKVMAAVVTGMMAFSLMACSSSAPSGNAGSSASKGKDDKKITIWAWDDSFNIKAANMAKERYLKNLQM